MKLYGTTTSPFVRRVRIVAAELGVEVDRIDTATEAGQAALRAISPIRKVPVAELDGATIFDSREIIAALIAKHGWGRLVRPADPIADANLINACDAALDSVIQLFYLRRDGIAIDGNVFATRQLDRTDAIFAWLGDRVTGELTLAAISVVCALDWMAFRQAYPVERAGKLGALRDQLAGRPSFVATAPRP
jgi:glutathione S-transferase